MAISQARLKAAIDEALNVPHGSESQRGLIADRLATAIITELEQATVVMPSCNAGGAHPIGHLE